AYFGISLGASRLLFPAVEGRYVSVVMMSAGIHQGARIVPEADPVNFAPFIKVPKLMVSGRYDEAFSLKAEVEPLFRLLREPKKLMVFEGGHVATSEVWVPVVKAFLDETLGPVR